MSVALMGFGTGLGAIVQIFISRTLGAGEYGAYAYVLGLLNIARTVVTINFDMAALRFAGVYHSQGDWPRFRGFLWLSRRIVAALSIIGAVACVLASLLLRDRLPVGLFEPLVAGCLLLAPASLLSLEVAVLQSLRRVYEARVPSVFVRPILLAAILYAGVYGFGWLPTATLTLWANLSGAAVALAASLWWTRGLISPETRRGPMTWNARELGMFCVVNFGQSLVYLLLSQQADIVIVGSMIGTKDAGFYAAASQIATLLVLGVVTVNQFTAPLLAEFHDRRTDAGLKQLLARVTILNAGLSLPLIVVVVALGPWLLSLFGPSFVAAYPVIVILAAGSLVNALWGGLWGDLLTMIGFQNESAAVVVAVTVLNLGLTIVLTPRLGIVGAAYATTAAVLVRSMLVALIVHRKLGFSPWSVLRHAMG